MGDCVASRMMVFAFISRDKIVDSATHTTTTPRDNHVPYTTTKCPLNKLVTVERLINCIVSTYGRTSLLLQLSFPS